MLSMPSPSLGGVDSLDNGSDDGGVVKVVGQLSCLLMVMI
jgi:hypothetical protein